jgi:hypothetical protein
MMRSRPVANRSFENYPLVVALTMTLGLEAIIATGTFLSTLDSPFATSKTTSLGAFSQF